MAASASASLACDTSARSFPVKGSCTGAAESAWRHWPPMRNGRGPCKKKLRAGRWAYGVDSTEEAEAGCMLAACSAARALATRSSVPQSAIASIGNAS
jgi:hypothetical protein